MRHFFLFTMLIFHLWDYDFNIEFILKDVLNSSAICFLSFMILNSNQDVKEKKKRVNAEELKKSERQRFMFMKQFFHYSSVCSSWFKSDVILTVSFSLILTLFLSFLSALILNFSSLWCEKWSCLITFNLSVIICQWFWQQCLWLFLKQFSDLADLFTLIFSLSSADFFTLIFSLSSADLFIFIFFLSLADFFILLISFHHFRDAHCVTWLAVFASSLKNLCNFIHVNQISYNVTVNICHWWDEQEQALLRDFSALM